MRTVQQMASRTHARPHLRASRAPLAIRALSVSAFAAATLSLASAADAEPCSMLPNPVYVTGGGKVVLAALAKALAPSGTTIVYKLQGSCLALDAILNGTKITGVDADGATYWDAVGEYQCDLDLEGNVADVGISDVFASTCKSLAGGLPPNVGDFFGPVESYSFVVPEASTQTSISKEAAYFILGFGNDSGVEPWTDENFIFQRDAESGTQQMLAVAAGVPATQWKGQATTSSKDMVSKLANSLEPEKTIGILTSEVAGENRLTLTALAFQDSEQTCGYWPDSTSASFDKRNVRDGHYTIWGPLHLFTMLDANGYPINQASRDIIGYLTGTLDPPNGLKLIDLLAHANIVPECAMQVKRTSELGPLASFAPERSCGCYYEFVATGMSDCKACKSDVECGNTQRCNYGFCEYQ